MIYAIKWISQALCSEKEPGHNRILNLYHLYQVLEHAKLILGENIKRGLPQLEGNDWEEVQGNFLGRWIAVVVPNYI